MRSRSVPTSLRKSLTSPRSGQAHSAYTSLAKAQSRRPPWRTLTSSAKGHVRLLEGEYVDHSHRERNDQGLDNQLRPRPPPPVSLAADVQRRERLGGWLTRSTQSPADSRRAGAAVPPGGRMSGRPIKRTLRPRRGGRRAVRTGGAVDGHPEDRAQRSSPLGLYFSRQGSVASSPSAKGHVRLLERVTTPIDHAGHRSEGAHHGDAHAEADRRARPAGTARSPPRPHRSRPAHALRRTPTGPHRHAHRVRQVHPPGPSPAAGWLSPRKWRYTTSTSRASRPKHHRPSVRASGWAPTPRPNC